MGKETRVMIQSMIINTFLIIIKITFGIVGRSKTLIADGIHSFSDLATDVIAILGNVMARKPADENHPFGHGKIEYLTSILIGIVIFILGITLVITGITAKPQKTLAVIVYVSMITTVVKYTFSSYMLKKGKKYKNNILIASGIESRSDALTPLFVIISYLCTKLTKYSSVFKYSDNIFTIMIGLYILITGFKVLKENIISIIGKKENDQGCLEEIKEIITNNDEILYIQELTLLKYGPYYLANIAIELNENLNLKDTQEITIKLRKQLCNKKTKIAYLQIDMIPRKE